MAHKVERKSDNKKGGDNKKKETHMPLSLVGTLKQYDTFGEGGKHLWFTFEEPDSGKTLFFKMFDYSEDNFKTINDCDKATVYFDINRVKNGDVYITQLVAYDVVPVNGK